MQSCNSFADLKPKHWIQYFSFVMMIKWYTPHCHHSSMLPMHLPLSPNLKGLIGHCLRRSWKQKAGALMVGADRKGTLQESDLLEIHGNLITWESPGRKYCWWKKNRKQPFRMPKCWFYTSIKTFCGIPSGAGVFSPTVSMSNFSPPQFHLHISSVAWLDRHCSGPHPECRRCCMAAPSHKRSAKASRWGIWSAWCLNNLRSAWSTISNSASS